MSMFVNKLQILFVTCKAMDDTAEREECGKAIRGRVAYPKDEIQHKDHVLHARTNVRKVVASSAIIHHRVTARRTR